MRIADAVGTRRQLLPSSCSYLGQLSDSSTSTLPMSSPRPVERRSTEPEVVDADAAAIVFDRTHRLFIEQYAALAALRVPVQFELIPPPAAS